MTVMFEERERSYESKWAHEQEAHFKIMADRNAALGRWAAAMMKLPSGEAGPYVQAVINAGVSGRGADPVFEKVRGDLAARGVTCPDSVIHRKMKELYEKAEAKILAKD